MGCRAIAGLRFAERCEKPPFIPQSKPRKGAKRYGKSYEAAVAKRTGGTLGQWWHFLDANGEGWCQTDVLLVLSREAIVIECKLTEVDDARKQLGRLYLPVVARALGKPTRGIVVARYLSRESDERRVVRSLSEALACAEGDYFPTLHWIGKGPI